MPTLLSILATATPTESALLKGVVLMVVGMGVVFVALTVILGLILLVRKILEEKPVPATQPEQVSTPAQQPVQADDGVTPELVAVLTAAAVVATGKPVRLRRIAITGARSGDAWVAGGRQSLMGSHRPKH